MKFYFFVALLFYALLLLQVSFLSHLNFWSAMPNIFFITFFVLLFSYSHHRFRNILFLVFVGGFFSDMFFTHQFGISIGIFSALYVLKRFSDYFIKNAHATQSLGYFTFLFLVSFCCYQGILLGMMKTHLFPLHVESKAVTIIASNTIMAVIIFSIYRRLKSSMHQDRQLTLL